MLSFRSEVEPALVFDTWTVLPNVILMSHAVSLMVMEFEVSWVTVPRATALVPGDGVGAPGLGQTAAPPPPPPRPPKAPAPPGVREAWAFVVLALTLFWPIL